MKKKSAPDWQDWDCTNNTVLWTTVPDMDTLWVHQLLTEGEKWIGKPYLYGGTGPESLDCSALMQNIFRAALGLELPRRAVWQASLGWPVTRERLQKGDLVFFASDANQIDHVGLYWGQHMFLNATVSRGVMLSSLEDPYWSNRFRWGRRVRFGSYWFIGTL